MDTDDRPPIIIRRGEAMVVKDAMDRSEKDRKTVIDLVRRHRIGRQLSPTGPIEIHRAGFEMALAGDEIAIELLRAGDRANPRVARYFIEAGIPV
jgi:hypothetical protein